MRVVWLYGPPGVGKSTTAWEVLNALTDDGAEAAYVDIDQLGMVYPAPDDDPFAERLAGHALTAVAREYERMGAEWLVVSGVLNPDLMPFYLDPLCAFRVNMVRLTVDVAELKARMDARGVDDAGWQDVLEDVEAYQDAGSEFPVVVAGGVSPAEVARHVLDAVAQEPQGARTPTTGKGPLQPDTTGTGQAILVGGTRGVGKSSAAWAAFMVLREQGRRAAFLDLRQVGFFGRDGGPVNHELQAATLAALWRIHLAAGANVLILNGPVDTPDQVETYKSALGGTALTSYRLTADQQTLGERIRARGAGEGSARLAGDDLAGLDNAAAQEAAQNAFRAQQHVNDRSLAEALDTSHMTVHEVAAQVLRSLE